MTTALFVLLYACLFFAVAACAARAVFYARLPLHLRWELYPVPHEDPKRVNHGGSYFEEVDWWKKSRKSNLIGEARVMIPEILFLKGLWEFNRKLWFRSFPFHFGLYLLIKAVGVVLLAALAHLLLPSLMTPAVTTVLHWIYTLLGGAGAALCLVGSLSLLVRRLTDPKLKIYTTPGDILNLLFFTAVLVLVGLGYLLRGPGAPGVVEIARGLLTFDTSLRVPALLSAGLALGGLLTAYIPLTHMSHFIGKYFTYHSVRWSDEPNLPGSKIEKTLAEYLTYRPTWSAGHVAADGTRTWAEVATHNPTQGESR